MKRSSETDMSIVLSIIVLSEVVEVLEDLYLRIWAREVSRKEQPHVLRDEDCASHLSQ